MRGMVKEEAKKRTTMTQETQWMTVHLVRVERVVLERERQEQIAKRRAKTLPRAGGRNQKGCPPSEFANPSAPAAGSVRIARIIIRASGIYKE